MQSQPASFSILAYVERKGGKEGASDKGEEDEGPLRNTRRTLFLLHFSPGMDASGKGAINMKGRMEDRSQSLILANKNNTFPGKNEFRLFSSVKRWCVCLAFVTPFRISSFPLLSLAIAPAGSVKPAHIRTFVYHIRIPCFFAQ